MKGYREMQGDNDDWNLEQMTFLNYVVVVVVVVVLLFSFLNSFLSPCTSRVFPFKEKKILRI